jgi:hypothetical protein
MVNFKILQRSDRLAWVFFPELLERVVQFMKAEGYEDADEIREQVQVDFAMSRGGFFLAGLFWTDGEEPPRMVGHCFGQVVNYYHERALVIHQLHKEHPGGQGAEWHQEGVAALRAWAKAAGCRKIITFPRTKVHERLYRLAGFESKGPCRMALGVQDGESQH